MFPKSLVPQTMALVNAQASSSANATRKLEVSKAIDLYEGQFLEHLDAILEANFSEPSRLPRLGIGLIKKIVDRQPCLQATASKDPGQR